MDYLNYADRDDRLSGGVKMIPITTPHGDFKVWTKRTGNNPRIKLLLLHGGPGATHETFEAFDSFMALTDMGMSPWPVSTITRSGRKRAISRHARRAKVQSSSSEASAFRWRSAISSGGVGITVISL